MSRGLFARIVFFAYLAAVTAAYVAEHDRLITLSTAFLVGFGYLWRVMYVEDSERIIRFFDLRVKEVIVSVTKAISDVHDRIDKHHPEEKKND